MEKPLRIKLFGESLKIHKLKIETDLMPIFVNTANKVKLPLTESLLDIDFFRILNIKEFQCLNDLIGYTFSGLINNHKNQVEITYGRKRIAKFNIDELLNPTTLFPLYKTQVNRINLNNLSAGIYIEEREIGLIGTHEVIIEELQIDLLNFYLTKIELMNENLEVLNIMTYKEQLIPCVKSDALLRYQRCFLKA